jgi:hypothetical protein
VRVARVQRFGQGADASAATSAPTLSPEVIGTSTAALAPTDEVASGGLSLSSLWAVSVISGLTVWGLTRYLDSVLRKRGAL